MARPTAFLLVRGGPHWFSACREPALLQDLSQPRSFHDWRHGGPQQGGVSPQALHLSPRTLCLSEAAPCTVEGSPEEWVPL